MFKEQEEEMNKSIKATEDRMKGTCKVWIKEVLGEVNKLRKYVENTDIPEHMIDEVYRRCAEYISLKLKMQ